MKVILYFILWMAHLSCFATSLDVFKSESRAIVQSLLGRGFKKIGKIDLELLDQQISETRWESVKDKFLLGSGEARSTSIYLVAQRTVIVNELSLSHVDPSAYPQISLHEALGANGYNDEKSQISLSLDQIARNPSKRPLFEKRLQDSETGLKENKVYKGRAGGTSVGGGGDGTAIEAKKIVLQIALDNASENVDTEIESILESDFEPNWKQNEMNDLRVQRLGSGFRIEIPSILWLFNKSNMQFKQGLALALYNQLFRSTK